MPKTTEEAQEERNKSTTITDTPHTISLLKRLFLFLEDGDWSNANDYSEKILDINPECAEAYLGKLMAEFHVNQRSELNNLTVSFADSNNYQKFLRFASDSQKHELESCITHNADVARKKRLYDEKFPQLKDLDATNKDLDRLRKKMSEYESMRPGCMYQPGYVVGPIFIALGIAWGSIPSLPKLTSVIMVTGGIIMTGVAIRCGIQNKNIDQVIADFSKQINQCYRKLENLNRIPPFDPNNPYTYDTKYSIEDYYNQKKESDCTQENSENHTHEIKNTGHETLKPCRCPRCKHVFQTHNLESFTQCPACNAYIFPSKL